MAAAHAADTSASVSPSSVFAVGVFAGSRSSRSSPSRSIFRDRNPSTTHCACSPMARRTTSPAAGSLSIPTKPTASIWTSPPRPRRGRKFSSWRRRRAIFRRSWIPITRTSPSPAKRRLSYKDGKRSGESTFNYSSQPAVQQLTDLFQDLSTTLEFGRRLHYDHRYQKLALDEELKRMEETARNGPLVELTAIAPILQQIVGDATVMNVSRARAQRLLGNAAVTSCAEPGVPRLGPATASTSLWAWTARGARRLHRPKLGKEGKSDIGAGIPWSSYMRHAAPEPFEQQKGFQHAFGGILEQEWNAFLKKEKVQELHASECVAHNPHSRFCRLGCMSE